VTARLPPIRSIAVSIRWARTSGASFVLVITLLGTVLATLADEVSHADRASRGSGRLEPVTGQPAITALTFTPEGTHLLAASQQGVIQRSWPGLELVREFPNPWLAIHDLAFSPEGDRLGLAGGEPASFGGLAIWSWPDGHRIADAVAHDDVIYQLAWKPDGNGLVTVSGDRSARRWSWEGGLTARGEPLAGHSRAVTAAVVLPELRQLVTASRDHSLRLWDLDGGVLLRTLDNHTAPVTAMALRPQRPGPPWVVSCGEDRTVRFWQPTIGRLVRFARLPSVPLAVAWLPEGDHVAVGCHDGQVRIISALGRSDVRQLEGTRGWAYAVAVAPEGDRVVVAGERGEIRIVPLSH
jgi:WD40 repeat protein